ncbi:outer dense fiber protein 3-like protein 2 [Gallus gallus]|uniref:outer dense fiber protein 3-like protein 2 n=1 Tax=Gallus gallus TaxID=9031 RepID=UPI001F022784|nr:outer dense fiber protein 3-like protein 2 [Gallus gallus]
MGPNTVYTSASPCYSVRGRSQRGRFDEDLAKTPGPAALPKVPVDAYKTRAPAYTMAARPKAGEGKAAKPGPADYSVGPGKAAASALPLCFTSAAFTPLPLPLRLPPAQELLAAGTKCRTAGLPPALVPPASRGREGGTAQHAAFPPSAPFPFNGTRWSFPSSSGGRSSEGLQAACPQHRRES